MDLDTMWARFEREYCDLNSTTPGRRHQILVFLRQLDASIPYDFSEVTAADVNALIGSQIAEGLHPNTGRKVAGMARVMLRWAEREGLLTHTGQLQSVRNPRGSTAKSQPKPYKQAELVALRRALAERYPLVPTYGRGSRELTLFTSGRVPYLRRSVWRHAKRLQLEAQIALGLELGLRKTEIFHAPLEAIHPDNVHVVIRTAKQGPGSDVKRVVPYTAHARRTMEEWLDFRYVLGAPHDSPWLQLGRVGDRGAQLSPQTFRAFGDSISPLEGQWNWHRLRHTCATEWLRAGVPLEKVRKMMGHATLDQTLAYTHIDDEDIESAVHDAEERFNSRMGFGEAA